MARRLLLAPSTYRMPPAPVATEQPARRRRLRAVLATLGVAVLSAAMALGGQLLAAAPAAAATTLTVNQCNNILASAQGATTGMDCSVVVVNTIAHGRTSSVTTVTRTCSLAPCPPGNGTFVTRSTSLVTRVIQCDGSGNDAAHRTTCSVSITNNISADTPGAQPVSAVTSNQCVGSGQGGGGSVVCDPFPATTTGATITQCNGSGNGGGGTVHCTIPATSRISKAIPVTVNQCNGTANPGGSVLTCTVRITTTITSATSASPSATSSSSSTGTSTPTPGSGASASSPGSSGATSSTGSRAASVGNVARTPSGGVAAGEGAAEGSSTIGWIAAALALFVAAGVLAATVRPRTDAVRIGRHR